jgi:hypothetical protein
MLSWKSGRLFRPCKQAFIKDTSVTVEEYIKVGARSFPST